MAATTSTTKITTRATVLVGCFLMVSVLLLCSQPTFAAPSCSGTRRGPVVTDADCEHGLVADWCNRPTCGKGPGQPCGGRWNEQGMCGSGMFCGCNICHGCNTRLQCYFNAKC